MSRFSSHDQKQLLFHRSKLGLADFSDIWLILLVPSQGLERRSCCKLARRSKEIKDKKNWACCFWDSHSKPKLECLSQISVKQNRL